MLKAIGITGDSGSFTAIAFAKPQDLPVQLSSAHTKLNLAFTISNHTSNAEDYQWAVTVTANKKSALVGNGHAQLVPNDTTTVTQPIEIVCKTGRAEVTVSLKGLDEHIDAWMTCG